MSVRRNWKKSPIKKSKCNKNSIKKLVIITNFVKPIKREQCSRLKKNLKDSYTNEYIQNS